MRYLVEYTEPEATFPAPVQTAHIVAGTDADAWKQATLLGYVKRIYDERRCVYSHAWDFNFMGLTNAQLKQNA